MGDKSLVAAFFEKGVFDRRYGGDLQGVLDRLDYLQDLGINAIYFNPVFYGKSLHKYDGASMHHIDPYFGPDPAGDLAIIDQETSDPKTWQWTAADKLFLELVKENPCPRDARHYRRRIQSHGPRFLCLCRPAGKASRFALQGLVHRSILRRSRDAPK